MPSLDKYNNLLYSMIGIIQERKGMDNNKKNN